jgi:hypothetical protein
MRAAIIGAARNHNGIGEYIAKYLSDHDVDVSCVLGSTQASSASAAAHLNEKYSMKPKAYTDFSQMIQESQIDCVAIASPAHTHKEYIDKCIDAGVHILCEKPFISPDMADQEEWLENTFVKAREKGISIAMNSQWPFCFPSYEELCGRLEPEKITEFTIRLSPMSEGRAMIPDSVPHALSLLYYGAGDGIVEDVSLERGKDALKVRFTYLTEYVSCAALIEMVRETEQPRTFSFGFNGCTARRHIDMKTYTLNLTNGDKILKIADPLGLSVRDFVESARTGREPVIGRRHITHTVSMLRQIYTEYANA